MIYKINVTKEHIENGKKLSSHFCPIALALRDALGIEDISVTPISIRIDNNYYNFESNVYYFVRNFDRGMVLEPFSFELEIK